jgi:translation initiation factor 2B subunit (eIF-2B alpha/beta/delta family)
MQQRWEEWITNEEFYNRLIKLEKFTEGQTKKQIDTSYYTHHDAPHCRAVENLIKTLLEKNKINLSEIEKFILFSAVWTHDIGMFEHIAYQCFQAHGKKELYSVQTMRQKHDEIAAWYLFSHLDLLKIQNDNKLDNTIVESTLRNYVNTINLISKYHRAKSDVNECPRERILNGEKIRTRLLACLLRLGDTLHVDSTRFDRRLYDMLQIGQMDRSARLHWLKSYLVSSVFMDPENETIFVNIDVPESLLKKRKKEWEDSRKTLESEIINGIINDVLAVRPTFKEYGFPAYLYVKLNFTYIPGYPKKDCEEISGIMGDLGVVFFPNASMVIEKALDSIASLCKIQFKSTDHFYHQMDQLLSYLDQVYLDRSAHVGLSNVIEAVKDIFKRHFDKLDTKKLDNIPLSQVTDCQNKITQKIKEIRESRKKAKEKIWRNCSKTQFGNIKLDNIEHIILIAYSEMVITFLEKFGQHYPEWKDQLNLYVLECSGKRRLVGNNEIEYNDGLYYSHQLSRKNFNKIFLLPDTSLPSLAFNLEQEDKIEKTLVLFGVSGIDEKSKDCFHDSGHLLVAIVAKYFSIPIMIIADSFKMDKTGMIKKNWKRDRKRETEWLTSQRALLKDLQNHNITLVNYSEDMIPGNMIDFGIMDINLWE